MISTLAAASLMKTCGPITQQIVLSSTARFSTEARENAVIGFYRAKRFGSIFY
jgi:hypothetical protein